jgi:hypothetical protein
VTEQAVSSFPLRVSRVDFAVSSACPLLRQERNLKLQEIVIPPKEEGVALKDRGQVIRPAKFLKHDPVKRGQESGTVGRREAVSGRFSHKERKNA